MVAEIVVAAPAEARLEELGLAVAAQVQPGARAVGAVEEPQMRRRRVGDALVGGGDQMHLAPRGAGLADQLQRLLAPGQAGDVELHPVGDRGLHRGLAAARGAGDGDEIEEAAGQQADGALVQRVDRRQGAVEVDDQRRLGPAPGRVVGRALRRGPDLARGGEVRRRPTRRVPVVWGHVRPSRLNARAPGGGAGVDARRSCQDEPTPATGRAAPKGGPCARSCRRQPGPPGRLRRRSRRAACRRSRTAASAGCPRRCPRRPPRRWRSTSRSGR